MKMAQSALAVRLRAADVKGLAESIPILAGSNNKGHIMKRALILLIGMVFLLGFGCTHHHRHHPYDNGYHNYHGAKYDSAYKNHKDDKQHHDHERNDNHQNKYKRD